MKVEKIALETANATRNAVIADGPILGARRKFRVNRLRVNYTWRKDGRTWAVTNVTIEGPLIKKDGTEGNVTVQGGIYNFTESTDDVETLRRIARNLAPVGDPVFPGVLDA